MEGATDTVGRLVRLLAQSRAVELDVIAEQFGAMIAPNQLEKIRRDLEELQKTVRVSFSIFFKSPSERGIQQHGPYQADPDEWERLKADFKAFVDQGTPKVGTYRIWFNNRLQEKVLDFRGVSSLG